MMAGRRRPTSRCQEVHVTWLFASCRYCYIGVAASIGVEGASMVGGIRELLKIAKAFVRI